MNGKFNFGRMYNDTDIERSTAAVVNAYLKQGTSLLYVRWMGAPGAVSYSIEFVPIGTSVEVQLQGSGGVYFVDAVTVTEAAEEASEYQSAIAQVVQTNDYSPFGAPLAGRTYKPIDENNKVELVKTTFDSGTDGWVSNGATLGNSLGRLQLLSNNSTAQSAQKTYTNLLTIGKKYRVSFDFGIDGITSASYTLSNGSVQLRNKENIITTKEVTEFTATATNLTLLVALSTGNYSRLAHIDNLVIEEIFEVGEGYRFGFNGKEDDNEVEGQQDYGMRIYDKRLARFKSVDPLTKEYPMLTPYQFASNCPVDGIDLDGLEHYYAADGRLIGKIGTSTEIRKVDTKNVRTVAFWINSANKPPKAADVGFTGRATNYANSFSYANPEKAKREPSTFYRTVYGNAYSRGLEGTDNGGNDRVAFGGPDAAGASLGGDFSFLGFTGGTSYGLLETEKGVQAFKTTKVGASNAWSASITAGPSIEIYSWKTKAYKNQPTSSLVPGNGDAYSLGLGINVTVNRSLDSKNEPTLIGISLSLGAGFSATKTFTEPIKK